MATPLETILTAAAQEPLELPRLPASGVFIHYERISTSLERLTDAYHKLPTAAPQAFDSALLDIAKECDIISKAAMRLREANR